jgi:stage V sporulation protein AD
MHILSLLKQNNTVILNFGVYMSNKILKSNARIICAASVVGHKEHDGPLGECFDLFDGNDKFNQKTWEKAEMEMQKKALTLAMQKSGLSDNKIGALFAGDLLNQCIGSAYGLLDFNIPYFGLYGACSTAVEGLMLSSLLISGGHFEKCASIASSHFCSAEQQYRTPLEYGGQRSPTAQWTVTGAAAFITEGSDSSSGVFITESLPGIAIDKGINDAANMGAAMAPAALDTLLRYFKQSNTRPDDYDAIFTGDLGLEGSLILREFMSINGYDLGENYFDCGNIIFDRKTQDVHSGGSGCGCSAVVLASYILPKLNSGELKNALIIGTGAMMSPSSLKQGLSIPAIAHLIKIEHR